MEPDNSQQSGRVGTPQQSGRSYIQTPPSRDPQYRQQEAAANIVRGQLDSIYQKEDQQYQASVATEQQPQPVVQPQAAETATLVTSELTQQQAAPLADTNPYDRTHSKQVSIQADQWKQYHSAWQDYYKKYYERYYTQAVAHVQHESAKQQTTDAPVTATVGSHRATTDSTPSDGPISRTQAMDELRQKLRARVQESAKKVRRSRHFVPIIASLAVIVAFVFLQYNQVIVSNVRAYISPGTIDPQNIIVDPNTPVAVGPESRLIIPKINVDTPVFYDIPTDTASQNKAMENGVAHFAIPGANSHPGEIGNTVLSGHSSNDVFAPGNYKFVFMQLDKLEVGDKIMANYNSVQYTYVITKKQVVQPTDVQTLIYDTDKPVLTLITCTPLGTALQRLLVTAEQISPAISDAKPAPTSTGDTTSELPSQGESTLLERLFGS